MPSTKATYISVPAKAPGDGPADRNLEKPASAPTKLSRRHTRHSIKSTDRFDDKLRHPWEVISHHIEHYAAESTAFTRCINSCVVHILEFCFSLVFK